MARVRPPVAFRTSPPGKASRLPPAGFVGEYRSRCDLAPDSTGQYQSSGPTDLRVWHRDLGCSGRFDLAPDSTGQNPSPGLTDFRAPDLRIIRACSTSTSVAMGRKRQESPPASECSLACTCDVRKAEDKRTRRDPDAGRGARRLRPIVLVVEGLHPPNHSKTRSPPIRETRRV